MTWTYKGKQIEKHSDLDASCTNIVYELEFLDGSKYIGKKTIRSVRRLKPTKAQLAIRKNYVRKEWKDIPFKSYRGSSKENVGKTLKSKRILYICSDKKASTYIEMALLFEKAVLFSNEYSNKCIGGTLYSNSLDGLIEGNEEYEKEPR